MDIIQIRDLEIGTLVGVPHEERGRRTKIKLNIELFCDLRKAGVSDDLADTVDYKTIEDKVIAVIANNEFYLLERLAEATAEVCLENIGVEKVRVKVEKSGTLSRSKCVVVTVERPWHDNPKVQSKS